MKDFCMGFLTCLCLLLIAATNQVHNTYKSEQQIYNEFRNVYGNMQSKEFDVYKSSPNLSDLRDGEIVLVSSTTKSLMARIGQSVYNVKFTTQ